jgi:hypothetical protein
MISLDAGGNGTVQRSVAAIGQWLHQAGQSGSDEDKTTEVWPGVR